MTTIDSLTASAPARVTLRPRSDILIRGVHAPAGVPIEVPAPIAADLLQGGLADIVKTLEAQKRETASAPPAAQETAAAPKAPPKTKRAAPPKAP